MRHRVQAQLGGHHARVRWRREDPLDPTELLKGIAEFVMRIDAKVDRLLNLLREDDGETEDDA